MHKIKVKDLKPIELKSSDKYKYTLSTNVGEVNLYIAQHNVEKQAILSYVNCPFYIILTKNITSTISVNDHFEISTDEYTLDLECTQSCGISYAK